MAIATENLTVSRDVYDAIVRRREEMREFSENGRPTLSDAVESFIIGSLVEPEFEKRKNCRRDPEDRILAEVVRTLK